MKARDVGEGESRRGRRHETETRDMRCGRASQRKWCEGERGASTGHRTLEFHLGHGSLLQTCSFINKEEQGLGTPRKKAWPLARAIVVSPEQPAAVGVVRTCKWE